MSCMEDVLPLANLGAIAAIDFEEIDTDDLIPEAMMEHALASSFYSTVLAYRADFWEGGRETIRLDGLLGCRTISRQPAVCIAIPQTTLEFALIADGVEIEDLYPLDVERALESLERIRPHLLLWWEQGAQPSQMITSGDIDMVSVWNSRIERLSADGAPVDPVEPGRTFRRRLGAAKR
jgi:putative spermidine/putrescine transport system substrate-binding protein